MTRKLLLYIIYLLPWLACIDAYPQATVGGQFVDSVFCRTDKSQSYALYLPAGYNSSGPLPLILIFDPAARGKLAVEGFRDAADKYGFILACSNNSRNGPMADNFKAASALLDDIGKRYSIDSHKIIAAGFSGGARFAMALATGGSSITGVIACGAGLPNDRNYYPTIKSSFLFYGIAGTRDMNLPEIQGIEGYLSGYQGITVFVRFFEGSHEWPPKELLTEAVNWIVMKSSWTGGKVSRTEASKTMMAGMKNLINSEIASGDLLDAVMHMRFAERDFSETTFATDMGRLRTETEKSAAFKESVNRFSKLANEEQAKKDLYIRAVTIISYYSVKGDTMPGWLKKEILGLKLTRDKGKAANSQLASRLLNYLSILCSEQGSQSFREKLYPLSAQMFEFCMLSDSENPKNYFNYARSLAAWGKTGETLDALSAAISHGLTSRKTVESESVFSRFRDNSRYRELLSKLK